MIAKFVLYLADCGLIFSAYHGNPASVCREGRAAFIARTKTSE